MDYLKCMYRGWGTIVLTIVVYKPPFEITYMYMCIGTGVSHGKDEVKDCDNLKPPFETIYMYVCMYVYIHVCIDMCMCMGS